MAKDHICYLVGNENEIDLWNQPWHPKGILTSLISKGKTDSSLVTLSNLNDIHHEGDWNPILDKPSLKEEKALLMKAMFNTDNTNRVIWKPTVDGTFCTRSAWESIRSVEQTIPWSKTIWFKGHIPRDAFVAWKALHLKLTTKDHIILSNSTIDNNCLLCNSEAETFDHIFFQCSFSSWVGRIWMERIQRIFEQKRRHKIQILREILANIKIKVNGLPLQDEDTATRKWIAENLVYKHICKINHHKVSTWFKPDEEEFKVNTDASLEEERSGIGGIIRDHEGLPILIFSKDTCSDQIYALEMSAIYLGITRAREMEIKKTWIEFDSLFAVNVIQGNTPMPWKIYSLVY
ncbi:uncharacterized protein LOC143856684 [Tasmannia lanceolata]|uniref:uncharacterized protein LOC143856684 n=1 Tax=Tasmannia lanceolata TaxID=3420 RepID=UPI0040647217